MKFFSVKRMRKLNIKICTALGALTLLTACASYKTQYGSAAAPYNPERDTITKEKPAQRFYLIGDAGYAAAPHTQQLFAIIAEKLKQEGKNATLFYLGDNIYPHGMPPEKNTKDTPERKEAEVSLEAQIALAMLFKGKTYFIPGNHDWYNGYDGLKEQEKFIKDKLGKNVFLPGKGCGITDIEIDDTTTLIAIDSQWYIEDWDNYPTINDDCSIKTREALFTELEDLLNKNQDKTIVLAIHHPLMSNGSHGGQFSARKHLYPLNTKVPIPIIGTVINIARRASGYSTQDIQSRIYNTLTGRIKALIQGRNNVIVISGHDHNLQYIHHDNIHQIISGSGSKNEAARAIYPNDFSYGNHGYAILDIYQDGTGEVSYFGIKEGKEEKLFQTIMLVKPQPVVKQYPNSFPATITATIYPQEMGKKSDFYNFLFGTHYREYYVKPIQAKTVLLDTLYGGLTPVKMGGGHQTMSLRLQDKSGKEYAMRGLKKSATRFLQAVAFKQRFVGDTFENTFAESFLMDFYTTAHPYLPMTTAYLAASAGIYHTNPQLYYVPKQNALGEYNELYGDGLYVIDEHVHKEHREKENFGNADDIENTEKVLKNLNKDPKYSMDERAYIRARLFDILIGDWDRHADQWKWSVFEKDGKVLYRPIPKDHDQAFTKYDGALLGILMNIPALRNMKTYKDDIRNIKWNNKVPYPLDLAFITRADEKDWLEEAEYIQNNLTDEAIEKAFATVPDEVKDETLEHVKAKLKARRAKLADFALRYRKVLLETVLISGTDKKERFFITRLPGQTRVQMYSTDKDKETLLLDKTYSRKETKELWIYGLDDNDTFEVKGKAGRRPIKLRLLGGQNHDNYAIEDGKKVNIYDFKSKENTYNNQGNARLLLTDNYETNMYDYKKPAYNVVAGYPSVGFNPDDGVKLGASINYTVNNFNRRPYSQKHVVKAHYYFATNGFELGYRGNFMNISTKWNFALNLDYTSPNFSISYFGMGNETPNFDDDLGMNYNRVKLQVFRVAPSIFRQSRNGSFMELQSVFETIEIDGTSGRYINQPGIVDNYLFEHRQFGGVNAKYSFENYDNSSLPALGMSFFLSGGWKTSFDEIEKNFPHAEAGLRVIHKLIPNDKLVLSTALGSKMIFNNRFEFYQGAVLGGDNDLRAYRRERFTGRNSFYHTTDVRYTIGDWKSSFIPMKYGLFGGYDYGRVWVSNDNSEKWHQSVGGGLFLNGVDMITARAFYFHGTDGGRFSFGLGFVF